MDFEALITTSARDAEFAAERASLPSGTEQAKAERDTFATRIWELEAAAVGFDGELDVVGRAMR